MNILEYRFSVAPMMDWNENLILSNSWRAACARCVHREIKENLETANVSGWRKTPWSQWRQVFGEGVVVSFDTPEIIEADHVATTAIQPHQAASVEPRPVLGFFRLPNYVVDGRRDRWRFDKILLGKPLDYDTVTLVVRADELGECQL